MKRKEQRLGNKATGRDFRPATTEKSHQNYVQSRFAESIVRRYRVYTSTSKTWTLLAYICTTCNKNGEIVIRQRSSLLKNIELEWHKVSHVRGPWDVSDVCRGEREKKGGVASMSNLSRVHSSFQSRVPRSV